MNARTVKHAGAIAVILLTTAARAWAAPRADQTGYTVTLREYDKRLIRVDAHVVLTDSVLLMYPEGASHLPDGWATFIRDLVATDDSGARVNLKYVGNGQWIVPPPRPSSVNLQYEVLIHHDAGPWPFGSKEAAYARDDCVFLTGKALFIAQYQTTDAVVRFVLPASWTIATPWADADDAGVPREASESKPATVVRAFRVPDVYELLEVGMLVGKHLERTIRFGGVEVTIAVGNELAPSLDLLHQTLAPLVPAAATMFGGTPSGRFTVIANRDVYDGGTSFTRSFDMVFRDPPSPKNKGHWGHIIAHELLHLWNGNSIRPVDGTQQYWFSEGFTDYLANLLELRTGIITERELFARLATHDSLYRAARAAAPDMSLRAAGDDKAKNYDLVYSGGLLSALVLDVELRRMTAGRSGIEDLMRAMYRDFGAGRKPFTPADLEREVQSVAGRDMSAFFKRFIDGTESLPINDALRALGLDAVRGPGKVTIRPRSSATQAERALRSKLLARTPR